MTTYQNTRQLGMAITPGVAPRVDPLQTLARRSPAERMILRVKALIGQATNKGDFITALSATGLTSPDGLAWSQKNLNPILENLRAARLLEEDLTCVAALRHVLAAELVAAPEGDRALDAVRRVFGGNSDRPSHYYYAPAQSDPAFRTRLRLSIYQNDGEAFGKLIEEYDRTFGSTRGPHLIDEYFADASLDPAWLASRDIVIQSRLFGLKLHRFLVAGHASADLPALLDHYRAHEDAPSHEGFKSELLRLDILAGRLATARNKIEAMPKEETSTRLLLLASVDFLEGRNDEAIAGFRQALKIYRKEVGRRKVFLGGANGLFFLLALIRANDSAQHAEIQTQLDAVDYDGNPYRAGFLAVQALLFLLRGLEPKSHAILKSLEGTTVYEPLSKALVALAEFLVDRVWAASRVEASKAQFEALAQTMPLVAGIHAEILARIAARPLPYEDFLRAARQEGPTIRFTGLIAVQQPWERGLESLANFLGAGPALPAAAPATQKTKRLVWFVDTQLQTIEAAEQSAKGRSWTLGRAVAMKRLHEHDPRLDYLSDHDRRALRGIRKISAGRYGQENYDFDAYATLLALVDHPLVFDFHKRDQPIELVAYPVELVVSEQAGFYRFALSHRAISREVFLEAETPTRWRVVDFPTRLLAAQEILGESGLVVPKQAREKVMALVRVQHPGLPIRADIADADLPAIAGRPDSVLQIQPLDEGLKVTMATRPFGPGGPFYLPGLGGQSVLANIEGTRQRANRDLDAEARLAKALLKDLPLLTQAGGAGHEWIIGDAGSALEFLLQLRERQPPVDVEWPEGKKVSVRATVSTASLSLKISRARDWFQMDGEIKVDEDLVLDMRDLLERLGKSQGRFVPLADGSFLALTEQFRKQLERFGGISEDHGKGRRLPILAGVAAQELAEEAGSVKADKEWKGFVERLSTAGRREPQPPSTLQADLRDYQLEGFRWLSRLAHWQAGACLADDMGLGKTVQAIAAMLEQAPHGPCLVIAPTSVCHNWEKELTRFAPSLTVHKLGAAGGRAAILKSLKAMDVLVLSYGLLHQEADGLADIDWRMAVFDEAQAIKNAQTRRAQAGQRIKAHFRVALTGTPIENYLDELWSLFAIVNPGLLGSRESFGRRFAGPIERNRDPAALQALRALIRPFMLRRTKSAVLSELPPRTEQTLEIELPDDERALYEAMRQRAIENLAELREKGAGGQNRIHILAEITKLRRACCHPGLVDPNIDLPGAKLQAFLELVEELIRNRHKALVFSQFVGQLERVREALVARGISHQYLDGGTPAPEREKRVSAFQAGEGNLFLISLKAGGTGLNLTAADYVIHLDPWWNPAVEDQASDRAHRIGQQRPVTVYRLIVRDSIEEKILALHRSKRDLASDLLEGTEVSARLSEDDLLNLIRA